MKNHMKLEFLSVSENEPFARNTIAAFCLSLNPTLDELSDIKTAVSEAVTNCIVHAYKGETGTVTIECETDGKRPTYSNNRQRQGDRGRAARARTLLYHAVG